MLRVPLADPTDDSIERYLAECFGTEVRVGILLGTRRVNQKPVLQVFDLQGRVAGYAKVGHNPLTAALVRREAVALADVGAQQPRSFQVPQVLDHGRWANLEVLVLSNLKTSPRQQIPAAVRLAAMHEVAHLRGTVSMPVVESGFWGRLRHDVERVADQPNGDRLAGAARALEERHGADAVSLGGWHGDWGAWNMGIGPGGLQVWDWERYDPRVPIGFDTLHFGAQSVRPGEQGERRQEEAFLRSVSSTLTAAGVPTGQHDLTLQLYLTEVGARYLDGLTYGATPALRRRAAWVVSLLERLQSQSKVCAPGRVTKGIR